MILRHMLRGLGLGSVLVSAITCSSAMAASCTLGVMANLPVTMDGLRASVPIKVNGEDTSFWLDSGAFFSIMSKAKAVELGLPLTPAPQGFYLVGIGGNASAEVATIRSFGIVGNDLKNVQFLVGGSDAGNGLIGRNILGLADTEFDLANGSVKLIMPHHCEKVGMAYWAVGKPYFTVPLVVGDNPRDHVFRFPVTINGTKIIAEYDSGAPMSLLSRRAAIRAGIDLSAPETVASDGVNGFGRRMRKGWVVPVASVGIGDEEILHTRLEVVDDAMVGADQSFDMLVGADYMLAHHIYVARDQRRIYFTYSGGKAFLTREEGARPSTQKPVDLPADRHLVEAVHNAASEPKTAEEFARRGSARMTARNLPGAIADLSEAIRLSPGSAPFYRDRARAYRLSGDAERSDADIDKALTLDPNDGDLLRQRAAMRLSRKDRAGALADVEAATKVTAPASLDALEMAQLFQRLDLWARAIPIYDAVIATHRDDSRLGQMYNGRCWARAIAHVDLDKALDDCNRAIKRDGIKAQFLDSRGMVYFRKGNFAAAIADYDAALKLDPQLSLSLYMRGLSKTRLGQVDAGKADQEAARTISPNIGERAERYGVGMATKG